MENMVERVNEKFLEAILEALGPTRYGHSAGVLASAYLDFTRAIQAMRFCEDWARDRANVASLAREIPEAPR